MLSGLNDCGPLAFISGCLGRTWQQFQFQRACQACAAYNHGYADGLSLTLQARANTVPEIGPLAPIAAHPTGPLKFEFTASDAEDGAAAVMVRSSNQVVIQDAWIVVCPVDGDPAGWTCAVVPGRTGAARMGGGRTILTLTATDRAGLRADRYVVVDVMKQVYLPAIGR